MTNVPVGARKAIRMIPIAPMRQGAAKATILAVGA
eukprot:CAMPEP_0196739058 /NCGR_PEP_ID=MMETSP1091-20130531/19298_1 /TAXON_ID=302021 /ORGANISM="Rhodomonas sp., Strain CCMP768" /LENGTH=34 /DNA_ID= /DNA_START= /DNA_END= /DNA_ORIENTATION=